MCMKNLFQMSTNELCVRLTEDLSKTLLKDHDTFLFDCDGVLWNFPDIFPGAMELLNYLTDQVPEERIAQESASIIVSARANNCSLLRTTRRKRRTTIPNDSPSSDTKLNLCGNARRRARGDMRFLVLGANHLHGVVDSATSQIDQFQGTLLRAWNALDGARAEQRRLRDLRWHWRKSRSAECRSQ